MRIILTTKTSVIHPAVIGIWVISGFLYVAAQGAPEKLKKAHRLLLWAFISTLIVFTIQGFMVAIKGTVNTILPGAI
jgi:predicted membrane protein